MPKRPKNYPKKGTNSGATRRTEDVTSVSDLADAKKTFETEQEVGPLLWRVRIRRRMHMDIHVHQDICFEVTLDSVKAADGKTHILNILDKIFECLSSMINHMRHHFDNSERRLVFPSVTSNSLESNLYLGYEDLHDPDADISNKLLQALFHVLMSNKELSLEDGFQINVVLLSMLISKVNVQVLTISFIQGLDHVRHHEAKVQRRSITKPVYLKDAYKKRFGAPSITVGNANAVPVKKYYKIPVGVYKKPKCFENNCLLVAISIGTLFHKAYQKTAEGDKDILKHLRALHYKSKNMRKRQEEAADFILQHTHNMVKGIPALELMMGPHSLEQMSPLCKKHKIQICLYSKAFGNKLVALVPEKLQLTYKKVHLLENSSLTEDNLAHVDLLLEPPKTADNRFYMACCLSLVHRRLQHKSCQHLAICWDCRRPMLKKSHAHSYMMNEFCTKLRKDIISHKLPRMETCGCRKTFKDAKCFEEHKKRCSVAYYCQNCQVMITAKNDKQLEEKRKNHQCFSSLCRFFLLLLLLIFPFHDLDVFAEFATNESILMTPKGMLVV